MGFRIDDQDFEVGAGSVFLIKPDELHGGIDESLRPAKWYWIHLHIPREHSLPGLTATETRELSKAYQQVALRTFRGSPQLRECFRRLLLEHRHPEAHGPIVARAILHELMVTLIRDHDRALAGVEAAQFSVEVQRAIEWLHRHIGEPLSIPEIAEASGLGQSHFRQRFHKETGFTPSDFLTRHAMVRAKELLRSAARLDHRDRLPTGLPIQSLFRGGFQKDYRDDAQRISSGPGRAGLTASCTVSFRVYQILIEPAGASVYIRATPVIQPAHERYFAQAISSAGFSILRRGTNPGSHGLAMGEWRDLQRRGDLSGTVGGKSAADLGSAGRNGQRRRALARRDGGRSLPCTTRVDPGYLIAVIRRTRIIQCGLRIDLSLPRAGRFSWYRTNRRRLPRRRRSPRNARWR